MSDVRVRYKWVVEDLQRAHSPLRPEDFLLHHHIWSTGKTIIYPALTFMGSTFCYDCGQIPPDEILIQAKLLAGL